MEDDILIEQFLRNTLSEEERDTFLARMKSDASFKEQVMLEKQLLDSLGEKYWSFAINKTHARVEAYKKILLSNETQELKTTIAKAIEQYKSNETISKHTGHRINLNFILRIAALFVIFFSIFWFFSKDDRIDYSSMSEKAWNKNVGLDFTLRSSSSDSIKVALNKALHFYTNKQYNNTLDVIEKYNASDKQYKDVLLLRALANYRLQKTVIAFSTLDSLKTFSPDVANWYKGLIYLDQKNYEKAILYLEIPPESHKEIKLKQ